MQNMTPTTPRQLAFEALRRVITDKSYSNLVFDGLLRRCTLSDADRRLAVFLFKGVLERRLTLDFLINHLINRPPDDLEEDARILLAMGLYQLRFADSVPDSAAVNLTVQTAKEVGLERMAGLINGVLRSDLRAGKPPVEQFSFSDNGERISVLASVDLSLVRLLLAQYPAKLVENYCLRALHPKTHYLRVNTQKTDNNTLIEQLWAQGIEATSTFVPHCLQISGVGKLLHTPQMADGQCYLQDITCQLAALAVQARPGDTVVDVCAAPGSKSFTIAQEMEDTGVLLDFDLHEKRTALIRQGAARLGLKAIATAARDGAVLHPESRRTADRVLCDVPCSGLGTWTGKPEIKYKSADEIGKLPEIQKKILCYAAEYVKLHGILVYSTCTVNDAENRQVTRAFLQAHPDFVPCALPPVFEGVCAPGESEHLFLRETFPCDGFYLAAFTRIAP